MDEQNVRYLLHQLGASVQRASYTGSKKRTRWMNVSCPFAPYTHAKGTDQNPSFGITLVEDARSHYKCLSCGMKGRLASLPTKLGSYRKKDYGKLRHWAEMHELQSSIGKPVTDWEMQEEDGNHDANERELPDPSSINAYPRALGVQYLLRRGITWPTPLLLNLRFDGYQRRILFPCFDRWDRFSGFTGRSVRPASTYSKDNPKVRDYFGLDKRQLFLRLPGQQSGKKIITEGLVDFAKGVQFGYKNSHAILGTALTPEKIDILISEGDPCYFFMDNDLAGWQALFGVPKKDDENNYDTDQAWAYQLYKELPVWIVPYPKPFEQGAADPGSMSKEQFEASIKRAWLFTGRPPIDAYGNPHMMLPV